MKQTIKRSWWKYLAVLLASVLLWCTVFSVRSKPKNNEILRILYVGEGLDTAALQADLTALLPDRKEITVTQEQPLTDLTAEWLVYRQFAYDILIFSAEYCAQDLGQKQFSRLSDGLLSYFPTAAVYTEQYDGTALPFALILHDDTTETRFCTYLSLSAAQTCLLFFSPESVNLGGENGRGSADDTAALTAAQFLTEALP